MPDYFEDGDYESDAASDVEGGDARRSTMEELDPAAEAVAAKATRVAALTDAVKTEAAA